MQAELNDFYKARLAQLEPLLDKRHRDKLSAPFLLSVPEAYFSARVRIMFVGKETNGWWRKLSAYYAVDGAFEALVAHYDKRMAKPRFTGGFWQMLRRTAHELAGGRIDAIAWSNIFRMDYEQGKKSCRNSKGFSELLTIFSQDMLLREVKLLKPDVILFASGPSYDDVLKEFFPDRSESERIVPRALWKFKAGGAVCYRLQHPQSRPTKNSTFKPVEAYYAMAFELIKERFKDRYLSQPPVVAGGTSIRKAKVGAQAFIEPLEQIHFFPL